MIIVSMLLSVSLNVGTIIVNSAKMSGNLSNGVRAFHSADSGIEETLYHVTRETPVCSNFNGKIKFNGIETSYSYDVEIDPNIDCITSAKILSTGTYESTRRIIEVSY